MYGCLPFGGHRRQAPHQGGGGVSVTVVSRGEGSFDDGAARVKIVVSRGELERIVAGVTRRQCGATARRRYVAAPAGSPEQQLTRAHDLLRRRLAEAERGAAVRRGEGHPARRGIPEEV